MDNSRSFSFRSMVPHRWPTSCGCCSPTILLSVKIDFHVEDEENGGDEGETANTKEGYEGPEGRRERRLQGEVPRTN